ncbi:NAD(P)-dependent oxidoreductase [Litoribrevibacter albus]|uniref:3-hydroxyisobutyrate dehydrogenase n=1 Tax=Litoribrevibacter albus TaxID=1473156 RepID=A0AA37S783_9GAMM|nr:NAD(P)-dependent oxidoreductase [Litoribrevibacter albus]GLQ29754.1 3-hydroxyisobutyrate dehydrogenase [Litoribrevibacter albus]
MSQQSPVLGFIGIGLMGNPMTKRLLAAGFPVNVWNRSVDKLAAVVDAGAIAKSSIVELVEASDVIMLCVSDTDAVRSVVFGEGGVVDAVEGNTSAKTRLLIDFSSIDPEQTREMAQTLKHRTGIEWVDSPVSGGVAGAEQGTLAIMCGGEESVIEQVTPILEPLSQRVTRMGPVGSGQVTKICNQMIVSCNVLVMAEVMAMAEKAGVDSSQIPQALKGGFADSIPLQLTGPRMATRDFDEVKWHVKTLLKDLDMANHLAKTLQSSIPMAGLGAELMRMHGSKGNMDQDPCTLIEQYISKN